MSQSPSIPETASKLFDILEPLKSETRQKSVAAVFAMLGEPLTSGGTSTGGTTEVMHEQSLTQKAPDSSSPLGHKAQTWMRQNGVDQSVLDEAFHYNGAEFEYICRDIPGDSARAKSKNCYLLTGIVALLSSDEASFQDSDARQMCERFGCYDGKNHSGTVKAIALSGSKGTQYTLTIPTQREAAEIVKTAVTI